MKTKESVNLKNKVIEAKMKLLNGIDYEIVKKELQPFIDKANIRGEEIAKEYGAKYKKLTFNYIMR